MIPKHYSLVKEHEHSYEIHDKRDGKSFHIAKRGLDLGMHGKLSKIQKFSDGGAAQEQTLGSIIGYPGSPKPDPKPKAYADGGVSSTPDVDAALSGQNSTPANSLVVEPVDNQASQPEPLQVEAIPPGEQAQPSNQIPGDGGPVAATEGQPAGIANTLATHKETGLDAIESSVRDAQKTEREAQQGIENTNKQYSNDISKMKSSEDIIREGASRDKAFVEDLQKNKLNPDHYWASRDTGQKISAGLGLLLGGLGAGLTRGPNMAMQVINGAIDRDMEAQRTDRSEKMNLWKMNREATHNELEANLHTRNQMLSAVEAKTRMYMAKMGNAEAQMKFAPLLVDIQRQKDENNIRLGVIKGNQSDIDPAKLVPVMVKDPADRAKVFSEIKAAQDTVKMSGAIMQAFEDAAKENTVIRTMGGVRTPGSVLALHQHMQPTFGDLEGTVRQSAMDNTFKNITPSPGDTDHKIQQKRDALQEYLQSKSSAPVSSANNIDLKKFTSTRPVMGAVQLVERKTADGKIALFNPKTKQFMGYKQ